MLKKNTLTARTIIYTVSKMLSQGINAIMAIVFVRLLSIEEYGDVSVYTAWVSIVSVFISLRTDGTIQMARTKYGKDKIDEYSSCAIMISILFFGVVFFIVLSFMMVKGDILKKPVWYIILVLLHSFGSACLKFRSAYYAITKEAFKDLVLSLIVSLLSFGSALLLVLIIPANKHIGRIAGFAFANILLGTVLAVIILKKGKRYFNKEYYRFCIRLSLPLIFSGLSNVIISQFDRLMLEKMVSVEATAIYSFGFNVVLPISIIWYALNHAWVPEYHELMQSRELFSIKKHSNNYIFVFTCLASGYTLICNEILSVLGTEDYYAAKMLLPLMTFYYYLQFLYTFPINYEFYKNNTRLLGIATTLAAIINAVLNYFLIPQMGMVGALLASILASLFMFLFHDFNARCVLKEYHCKISFYFKGIIPFVFAVVFTYIFMDYAFLRWSMGAVIGILLLRHLYKEKSII